MVRLLLNCLGLTMLGVTSNPNTGAYLYSKTVLASAHCVDSYNNLYQTNTIFNFKQEAYYEYEYDFTLNVRYNSSSDYEIELFNVVVVPLHWYYYDSNNEEYFEGQHSGNSSYSLNPSFPIINDYTELSKLYFRSDVQELDSGYVYLENNIHYINSNDNWVLCSNNYGNSAGYYNYYEHISGLTYYSTATFDTRRFNGIDSDSLSRLFTKIFENNQYDYGVEVGYDLGYQDGLVDGHAKGFKEGYDYADNMDDTVLTIFGGILAIGILPINFFLSIFNFDILGINLTAFVSSLMSIAIVIIVLKKLLGSNGE